MRRKQRELMNSRKCQILFSILLILTILILHIYYDEKKVQEPSVYDRVMRFKELSHRKIKKCGHFPVKSDFFMMSQFWQVFNTPKTLFMIFKAFYDDRKRNEVKILVYSSNFVTSEKLYCQFWYGNNKEHMVVSEVDKFTLLWDGQPADYSPIIASCQNPLEISPTHVALAKFPCDEVNNIQKIENLKKTSKKKFLVCVKDFEIEEDISRNLIIWFEFLKLLGVEKISIYLNKVHENVEKVLKFYEKDFFLEILNFKQPEILPNDDNQILLSHQISVHDCFYRNLNFYEFIVQLDIFELIIPISPDEFTWSDILSAINTDDEKFSFHPSAFKFKDSKKFETFFMKTDKVETIFHRQPLNCVEECLNIEIDKNIAQLVKLSPNCSEPSQNCVSGIFDNEEMKKYKKEILEKIEENFSNIFY